MPSLLLLMSKTQEGRLDELEMQGNVAVFQITAMLRFARILAKGLDIS